MKVFVASRRRYFFGIGRALRLCSQTINFTRDTYALEVGEFLLPNLFYDIEAKVHAGQLELFSIDHPGRAHKIVGVDRDHLLREFSNLANNAAATAATFLRFRRKQAWPIQAFHSRQWPWLCQIAMGQNFILIYRLCFSA